MVRWNLSPMDLGSNADGSFKVHTLNTKLSYRNSDISDFGGSVGSDDESYVRILRRMGHINGAVKGQYNILS
jgi:hypothetical protein